MPRNNQYTAETLLNRVLDRFEVPLARTRDITQTIDYTLVGGPAAQDEFHRVLRDAERAGGVALEQDRLGRFTGEFARVRLVDPDKLYSFMVRAPARATAETAHQAILTAIPEILADAFFGTSNKRRSLPGEVTRAFSGSRWARSTRSLPFSVSPMAS